MKAEPALVQVLVAGLEAMDYIQTASRGDWLRFGKFRFWDGDGGGDAYYVKADGTLWYSKLRCVEPDFEETGPFLDRVFEAGMARQKHVTLDADAILDELTGGSNGTQSSDNQHP